MINIKRFLSSVKICNQEPVGETETLEHLRLYFVNHDNGARFISHVHIPFNVSGSLSPHLAVLARVYRCAPRSCLLRHSLLNPFLALDPRQGFQRGANSEWETCMSRVMVHELFQRSIVVANHLGLFLVPFVVLFITVCFHTCLC